MDVDPVDIVTKLEQCLQENERLYSDIQSFLDRVSGRSHSRRIRKSKSSSENNGNLAYPFADVFGSDRLRNFHEIQKESFFAENLRAFDCVNLDWSKNEIDFLQKAVVKCGSPPVGDPLLEQVAEYWSRVSQLVGRDAISCYIRYIHFHAPHVNMKPWSKEEELRLIATVDKHGQVGWNDIALELGTGRSPIQCFMRFQRSLNPQITSDPFSTEEDLLFVQVMKTTNPSCWPLIATKIGGFHTPDQCSRRWKQVLEPSIRHGRWSVEQDKRLCAAVEVFGSGKWTEISRFIPGKTDLMCRERYEECLRVDILHARNFPWTSEEDDLLLKAVELHGVGNWSLIKTSIAGRTDSACMERFKVINYKGMADSYFRKKRIKQELLGRASGNRILERRLISEEDFILN